ncbi:MAG: hypothetical protein ACJAYG_002892 [Oceanicoccus sp.]|jgi:hypothetical protein
MPLSAIADVVLFGQIESVNDPLQGPGVTVSLLEFQALSTGEITIAAATGITEGGVTANSFEYQLVLLDSDDNYATNNEWHAYGFLDESLTFQAQAGHNYSVAIGTEIFDRADALAGFQPGGYLDTGYGDWRLTFSDNVNVSVTPVPVPAALPLFASAVLGLFGWRRRQR